MGWELNPCLPTSTLTVAMAQLWKLNSRIKTENNVWACSCTYHWTKFDCTSTCGHDSALLKPPQAEGEPWGSWHCSLGSHSLPWNRPGQEAEACSGWDRDGGSALHVKTWLLWAVVAQVPPWFQAWLFLFRYLSPSCQATHPGFVELITLGMPACDICWTNLQQHRSTAIIASITNGATAGALTWPGCGWESMREMQRSCLLPVLRAWQDGCSVHSVPGLLHWWATRFRARCFSWVLGITVNRRGKQKSLSCLFRATASEIRCPVRHLA